MHRAVQFVNFSYGARVPNKRAISLQNILTSFHQSIKRKALCHPICLRARADKKCKKRASPQVRGAGEGYPQARARAWTRRAWAAR